MKGFTTPQMLWPLVSAFSILAAACSGGGDNAPEGPSVGAITSQTVNQDTVIGPLAVQASEAGTTPDQLVVTAHSSNPQLLPDTNVRLQVDGSSRSLTLTPVTDGYGTAQITVIAQDAQGRSAETIFQVTVNPVYQSFTKVADTAFALGEDDTAVSLSGITLQPDADGNDDAFTALLQ